MESKKTIALVLSVLALTGFGCGKSLTQKAAEYSIEKSTGGKADVDFGKDSLSYTDKDGNQVQYGANVTIPADFPKDLPAYASATVLSTTLTQTTAALIMQTSDAPSDVSAWYETELVAQGWTKESNATLGQLITASFKKENKEASVLVSGEDGQTTITLTSNTAVEQK